MIDEGGVFAGYTIERLLGRGGMGSVYLARHPRLPRRTAMKLLNRELFFDTEIRARFEREADLVARLEHPNIVTVYDRGVEDDQLWISMRYIDGSDAASLPAPLDPARAVRIVAETAAALDFAHSQGVLHRDVKPANILIEPIEGGERVYLTDFGIARLHDDSAAKLTQTGTFTATLAFAAPEQLSGIALDGRADQYSLACTLYRLLTGTTPFEAANPVAVIQGHLQQPPPRVSAARPGLPAALDAVLQRAMAKRPDDRFASCAEFTTAATHALTGHPQPATPPGSTPGHPLAATPPGSTPGHPQPATPHGFTPGYPQPATPSGSAPAWPIADAPYGSDPQPWLAGATPPPSWPGGATPSTPEHATPSWPGADTPSTPAHPTPSWPGGPTPSTPGHATPAWAAGYSADPAMDAHSGTPGHGYPPGTVPPWPDSVPPSGFSPSWPGGAPGASSPGHATADPAMNASSGAPGGYLPGAVPSWPGGGQHPGASGHPVAAGHGGYAPPSWPGGPAQASNARRVQDSDTPRAEGQRSAVAEAYLGPKRDSRWQASPVSWLTLLVFLGLIGWLLVSLFRSSPEADSAAEISTSQHPAPATASPVVAPTSEPTTPPTIDRADIGTHAAQLSDQFPRMLPHTTANTLVHAGSGLGGAGCFAYDPARANRDSEDADMGDWLVMWRCFGGGNKAIYEFFLYPSPDQAAQAIAALPANDARPTVHSGRAHTNFVLHGSQSRTPRMVTRFDGTPDRAAILMYNRGFIATEAELLDWWHSAPLA